VDDPPSAAGEPPAFPVVYTVAEAAVILKCSQNWLRDRARERRIPHTMIGGSYHFTVAHLEDAIRLFERPAEPELQSGPVAHRPPESPGAAAVEAVPPLRARPPRRRRPAE
jgi:excisionase family DNA binding protein